MPQRKKAVAAGHPRRIPDPADPGPRIPDPGHQCYHCKQWVEKGEAHDCWTTTEAALTSDLAEDLRDAWERLRETAASFGEQRIYASHHSIMFSRKSCYFFVRPKSRHLELCVFLGRPINAPQIRSVIHTSRTRIAHLLRITHRDEVEAPITDWLLEAYELQDKPAAARGQTTASRAAVRKQTGGTAATARAQTTRSRGARKGPGRPAKARKRAARK